MARAQHASRLLESFPALTIAAVNGFALGGGCELAMACDFRLATNDCLVALPEVTIGQMPGSGGSVRVARIGGLPRAEPVS